MGPETRALVVCCSEAGQHEVAERLFRERQGGRASEVVAVPGGCWWIARTSSSGRGKLRRWATQAASGAIREPVDRWLSRQGLAAITLVAHEECGWYRMHNPAASAGNLVRIQGDDLIAAAAEATRITGLPVEGLFVATNGDARKLF